MGKRLVLLAALLVGGLGFGVWAWMSQNQTVQKIQEVAKDVDLEAEVGVDLSLKGVELTQGEAGATQWRLTAEKASYDQEQNRVEVDSPKVTYFLKDGGELRVTAPSGEVRQDEQTASLWPEVEATYQNNDIRAERLTWSGENKTLVLSGNVRLENPDMEFTAPELRVLLDQNTLTAENGVHVVLRESAPIDQGVAAP